MTPVPKKIAITGPESTGKSILAEQLARHYNTVWVPEYAREYVGGLNRPYVQKDILIIAKEQVRAENEYLENARSFLFCDTELIVTKIWSEVKYGNCHPWIQEMILKNRYDLFLLCNIDLPWETDPLREHPLKREYLFNLYTEEMNRHTFPYFVISGSGNERVENAVTVIETFFNL